MTQKRSNKVNITKKQFEAVLEKVFSTPVPQQESDQEAEQTSEHHPSGDYNGKRKSRDKTEGTEG